MVTEQTKKHFNKVSKVWENKIWVNDDVFDKEVIEFANFGKNDIVLDVGIGTGALAKKLKVAEVFGLDISAGMMEKCPIPRHRLILGNGENIPFLDDTFDVVMCRNLLKHSLAPLKILSEMNRVLKPKGKILIIESTPLKKEHCEIPTIAVRIVDIKLKTHRIQLSMKLDDSSEEKQGNMDLSRIKVSGNITFRQKKKKN